MEVKGRALGTSVKGRTLRTSVAGRTPDIVAE